MYTAEQIARFIINHCYSSGKPVSNIELQEILYCSQLQYMHQHAEPLFSDDFEAWKAGPVIPHIYYLYSGYGGGRIKNLYNCPNINDVVKQFLTDLIPKLQVYDPWELADFIRAAGSPWHNVYEEDRAYKEIISKESIYNDLTYKSYFCA